MSKRLARLIVFIAAVQILGGHWLALQSVAWVGMLANNVREGTLVVAIEKTFNGNHPCELCEVVKEGRDEEQKQQGAKVVVKLEAVLTNVVELALPEASRGEYHTMSFQGAARTLVPLTPPPLAS